MKKNRISTIKERLLQEYPDSKTELVYKNLYELLVCVMLSAQCTDKRVNIIAPPLFERYPDVASLALSNVDEIKGLIKSCSFFNNKAQNLKRMALQVMEGFDGEIPLDFEGLNSLAGVGQKTANVVLIEYKNENKMAVDTHVFRVAHRLGLSLAKTPQKTEEDLSKKFKTELNRLHQAMVLFGRYRCKAINPLCSDCFLQDLCHFLKNSTPKLDKKRGF